MEENYVGSHTKEAGDSVRKAFKFRKKKKKKKMGIMDSLKRFQRERQLLHGYDSKDKDS